MSKRKFYFAQQLNPNLSSNVKQIKLSLLIGNKNIDTKRDPLKKIINSK